MNITTFLRSHIANLGVVLLALLFSSIFFSSEVWAADCKFPDSWVVPSVISLTDDCLQQGKYTSKLVDSTDATDASLSWKGRERIKQFVDRLIAFGMLLAIGWLVIGGGYMASSVGNDQKVKKGKDAVKWSVIGMIVLIFSYPLMNAVINFVYQLGG